jgi:hypothetical protein
MVEDLYIRTKCFGQDLIPAGFGLDLRVLGVIGASDFGDVTGISDGTCVGWDSGDCVDGAGMDFNYIIVF